MSNVPDIRFKGFTDAWEQRELGEVVENIGTGKSKFITNNYDTQNKYPILGSTGVIGFDNQYDYEGEFVLTARVGANAGNLYKYKGSVKISDNTVFIQNKRNNFIYFLLSYFNLKKLSFGTGQPLIKASELKKLKLYLPNDQEQEKIETILLNLDNTITLLQRELDSLKLIKGSLLHKLFPGINEQNPCIRLSNFKEDWKSVKLADISNRVTRKNKDLESKIPLTISALYGLVDQTKYFSKQIASERLENYILIKKGEFAYNKSYSNGYPFGAVKRLDNYDKGVLSSLYIVFELLSIVDSNFMKYYFETKLWHKEVQKKSAEGARNHGLLNITATDFLSLKIKMPNDINEQVKIGKYFKSLDLKIDKLNQEIILYQKMKKGFLQKLFPKGD